MQAAGSATQWLPAGHLVVLHGSPASIGILPPAPPPAEPFPAEPPLPPFPADEPPTPPVLPLVEPPAPAVVLPVDVLVELVLAPPAPEVVLPASRPPSEASPPQAQKTSVVTERSNVGAFIEQLLLLFKMAGSARCDHGRPIFVPELSQGGLNSRRVSIP
jgi:hypothetical protein